MTWIGRILAWLRSLFNKETGDTAADTDIVQSAEHADDTPPYVETTNEPIATPSIMRQSHFTIDELCHSDVAAQKHIDNTPPQWVVRNLQSLIDHLLDPIREAYGKPIYVNSGYRCEALNKAVGGVSNSSHLYGFAADITAGSKDENARLWAIILGLDIPFFELINESGLTWIHISYDPDRLINRVSCL